VLEPLSHPVGFGDNASRSTPEHAGGAASPKQNAAPASMLLRALGASGGRRLRRPSDLRSGLS